jgi:uncharacterized protein (DUF1501 family)
MQRLPSPDRRAAERRRFLTHAGAITAAGIAGSLGLSLGLMGAASAQGAADYRAIVCLHLDGGNDAFNTVLATDTGSWDAYQAARGHADSSIALLPPGHAPDPRAPAGSAAALGGVRPIVPRQTQGRSFALHPCLARLRTAFDEGRLAIVANVGNLLAPTTKAQYLQATHPLPPRLGSHNDQAALWHAMAPAGASAGWAGRMADLLAAGNADQAFTAFTTAGRSLWATGHGVMPVAITSAGALRLGTDPGTAELYGSAELGAALHRVAGGARSGNRFETDHAAAVRRAVDLLAMLEPRLPPADDPRWAGTGTPGSAFSLDVVDPVSGASERNDLAEQLQTVLRVIAATSDGAIAARRQVFHVHLRGFDTHDQQQVQHASLLARVAHALEFFDRALGRLGLGDRVTLFTTSEFGRAFIGNGDGSDHGWGGHHLVLGGAVRGGDIYGRFPTLARMNALDNGFDSSPDQLANGVLLPSIAVDPYAATFGRWLGCSEPQLLELLPNLARFSERDLGFFA